MQQPCPLTLSQILQRLIPAYYRGQPSGAVGGSYNYAYVLADTVPPNKFWLLPYVSVIPTLNSSDAAGGPTVGLWVIRPGILPQSNLSPYVRNHAFFQGDIIPTIANGPPVGPYAIRVDQVTDILTSTSGTAWPFGSEHVMLKDHWLLVPAGCTLMASGVSGGFGVGGGLGEQYDLSIAYAEFSEEETASIISQVAF